MMKRPLLIHTLFCLLVFIQGFSSSIQSMSVEEKVGQLFMTFFWGEELNQETKDFFVSTKIGNVFYLSWANSLTSPQQTSNLSTQVSNLIYQTVNIPPLIAVDQEGGPVCRLKNGFTLLPSNMATSKTNPLFAMQIGKTMGRELVSVGINCNLAPVIDVSSSSSAIMNERTFGSDPEKTVLFASHLIQGLEESGTLYVLKHFPGYGSATVDPHLGIPIIRKSLDELEQEDLYPFFMLKEKAPAMMVAHILVPALDPKAISTFSSDTIQKLLRDTWNYNGVVFTDSLTMNACLENSATLEEASESIKSAALKAFLAGCDCMILGRLEWTPFTTTPKQDYEVIADVVSFFVEAVKEGVISRERLNTSVARMLKLKENLTPFIYDQASFKAL